MRCKYLQSLGLSREVDMSACSLEQWTVKWTCDESHYIPSCGNAGPEISWAAGVDMKTVGQFGSRDTRTLGRFQGPWDNRCLTGRLVMRNFTVT
jgi:hypothetical protein